MVGALVKNQGIFVQIAAVITLLCDPDLSRPDFDFQRVQPRCHDQRCARTLASRWATYTELAAMMAAPAQV